MSSRAGEAEPEGRDRSSGSELAGISLFFLLVSWLYLRLSPARFWSAIAPDFGDPLFNLSVMRWGASRVSHGFSELWSPSYFFPFKGALALSDHLVGPAVLYRLLDALGLPPAGAYNALLLIAFAGSGVSFHWVLRRSGLSVLGAMGGAFVWTFCGFRWSALSHLQVLLALAVPLTLWLFHRLLLAPSWPGAGRFLLAYGLQMSAGVYLAMMMHVSLLAILWVHAGEIRFKAARELRKAPLAAAAAACVAMLWTLFTPYLRIRESLGFEASTDELVPYLVTLKSYLSVGARTLYSDAFPSVLKGEAQLWPGLVAAALFMVGGISYLRRRLRSSSVLRERELWLFSLLLACCLLGLLAADKVVWSGALSSRDAVAPAELLFKAAVAVLALTWLYWLRHRHRWLERPGNDTDLWWKAMLASSLLAVVVSHAAAFLLLREALPGFDSIRVPARFYVFSSIGIAALAGLGIDRLGASLSRRGAAVAAQGLVLALLAWEFIPDARYLEWRDLSSPENVAAEYRWLDEEPGVHALLELPFHENWREAERMYDWTVHRRPIVNGYSGYLPASYRRLKAEIGQFPDREVLGELERTGVSHLVVHLDQCSSVERRAWRQWQKKVVQRQGSSIVLAREQGWVEIYRLIPPDDAVLQKVGGVR